MAAKSTGPQKSTDTQMVEIGKKFKSNKDIWAAIEAVASGSRATGGENPDKKPEDVWDNTPKERTMEQFAPDPNVGKELEENGVYNKG